MDAESSVSSNKLEDLRLLDDCEGGKKQKENGVSKGRDSIVKPNRPMTRSFLSQLLKNAKNNKMQACTDLVGGPPVLDGNVAEPKTPLPQIIPQKKLSVKLKPDEEVTQDKFRKKKEEEEGNSRKKSYTLTSVITAPRKAVCGLTNKPKEQIVDIDAIDTGNELAVVDYIEDIYKFYKLRESCPHDYINSQPEIDESLRATLVNWLVDVHSKLGFSHETLYLTISTIDRFLAVETVSRGELRLVGLSAMLIASKYEEVGAPGVDEFVDISDGLYTYEQIMEVERTIFRKLGWNLAVPTPYVFLVRFIKASIPDEKLENMAHFLSELGMTRYATIMYRPSMLAASAVLTARYTLNWSPAWNDTLKLHTGYSEEQLIDCARLMVSFHCQARNGKSPDVYTKYSDLKKGAVALMPPATNLLPRLCL
ncbi:hypothetical protein L6164_000966 [Bauhinia variegata]|uniref:Uncharacterized protein n=1 Tax=Bauhinia variegata TaxID=167791 RepID=A0ACB9Q8D1_BAUVA|nr:hypothetical protein L6164_000966 [Bauhinia variegata]